MPKNLHKDDDDLDLIDLNDDKYSNDNNKSDKIDTDTDIVDSQHKKKSTKAKLIGNNSTKRTKDDNLDAKEFKNVSEKGSKEPDNQTGDTALLSNEEDDDSKFFVVRVAGGQESMIASMLQSRLHSKKIEGIYSVLFLENFKGYVIVEAVDSNIAYEALHGIRHIRGQIRGELPFKDLEGYLIKKPVVTELIIDDTVEIIAGPFKSMKAKIMRVDYEKQEATVVLLDSPYQIPVTVDANYLKKSL
ncbi:transcription antitermination protein NusG [Candidatus Nitrosocosmicus oleophilus]|jgi:transcription elongation factor SPT5|uniref:Transcription elongation factor Spt5 n=1 Tax=Candidatus Nitrosocosmicus oleophilus TaxID=1353260 RepID=A0A654M456_9ARCH|nr:transcription elongation factor Spt5 [Candidatus Nitrosocosmicus oleophilus]ALI37483.1 transcription antitermination protein NusG [Candidatus Nitrosocosmicus oleophilus]